MGKIINIMIGLTLFLIILSFPKGEPKAEEPIVPTSISTTSVTSTTIPEAQILNYSEIKEIIVWINRTRIINVTNVTNVINYTYETMNLTAYQQKELMNMRPNQCFTAGCSDGFDKAKRECLAIVDLKAPKFRESFGTGYDPFMHDNRSLVSFYYDYEDRSIPLNGSFWYVTIPFNYSYINETVVRNGTFNLFRDQIKLRRIV